MVRVPVDGLGAVRGDDLAQMSQLLEDALSRDGVVVTRAVYPEAAGEARSVESPLCGRRSRSTWHRRSGRRASCDAKQTRADADPTRPEH